MNLPVARSGFPITLRRVLTSIAVISALFQPLTAQASLIGDDITVGIFVSSGQGSIEVGPTATVDSG